jgi:hypothetical protein
MTDKPVPGYAVMDAAHTTTGLVRDPAMTDPERRSVTVEDIARLRLSVRFVDRTTGDEMTTDDVFALLSPEPSDDGRVWRGFRAALADYEAHDLTEPAGPLDVERLRTAITNVDHARPGRGWTEDVAAEYACLDERTPCHVAVNPYGADWCVVHLRYASECPGAPREDERLREAVRRFLAWWDTPPFVSDGPEAVVEALRAALDPEPSR